ncbi:MAG TPA: methyl-accepting chemotaxis protein [Spirochaetota bacterium]|nr:methyl-accepting chemotaxis protein [Spirochaetota bacterium]
MARENFLERFFLNKYHDAPFIIQKKAQTLMYYTIVIGLLMIVLSAIFFLFLSERAVQANVVIFIVFVTTIVTLFMLKLGRYHGAANIFMLVVSLAVTAGLFAKVNRDAYAGYTTFIYFMIALIVQAMLFCEKKWIFSFTALFLVSDISFFFLVKDKLDPISLKAAKVGMVDSSFVIIFTFVLSYLVLRITEQAIEKSDEERRRSEESYARAGSLLGSVRETSKRLADSVEELSSTSNSFSEYSQNQAASAEEIMATIEEVSAGVDQVAIRAGEQFQSLTALVAKMNDLSTTIGSMGDDISEAVTLTGNIAANAKEGDRSLGDMSGSMQKIGESSKEMTGIVAIINGISDQINLLSLNATIEAARAGEAGRGFAVVADEISKLADRTADSLKEIDKLIKGNNSEIGSGLRNVDETVGVIRSIIEGVNTISSMMESLTNQMRVQQEINVDVNAEAAKVKQRSDEIKNSTEEQKTAVTEIVRSVASVNELTQSYAAGAERLSKSAKNVEFVADSLKNQILAQEA